MRKFTIYAASISAASFIVMVMLSVANPSHASADAYKSDRNCTDSSSEFNVVLVARVYDYNGNLKGFADNYNFHVHASEVWLNYRDYGPWNGTWKNTKQAGHDDYKQNSAGQWQWRDWQAWVPYTSDQGDMGWPTGHAQYSNETNQWMKLKSEAIRLWDGGKYYKTGVNADFTVAMNRNFTGTTAADDGMVSGGGNACLIPDNGGVMAPTYAFRDGDDTCHVGLSTANGLSSGSSVGWCPGQNHDLNNHSWSLSCLGGNDINSPGSAIDNMYFGFSINSWNQYYVTSASAYTSHVQAAAGGTWTSAYVKAANTQSRYVYLDYHEPVPPIMTPSASFTPAGDFEVGDTATAIANVSNSGSAGTATWTRQLWYDNGDNAWGPGDTPIKSDSQNWPFPTGNTPFPPWTEIVKSQYSRICTNLSLSNPNPTTTVFSPASTTPDCRNIVRRPYFQVFNGDINASASLSTPACAPNTTSTISAFNRGTAPAYKGSGTGIAAFAAGLITEFTSGVKPKGLTFANTGPAGSDGLTAYGGGFRSTYCVPDYWANPTHTGDLTATAATPTTVNDGDVYVTGSPSSTSFSLNSVPLRWIIATGNIYISNGVGQLDGNYIAKGNIYTCATGIRAPVPISQMASQCSARLVINGSLASGGSTKLQRTYGSLNDGGDTVPPADTTSMTYSSANPPCTGMTKLQLLEAGDPGTWNDNYLCIPTTDVNDMGGIFWTMNTNNPGAATPDGVAGRTVDSSHCAFMTSSNVGDTSGPGYWYDNAICSGNTKYVLQFAAAPINGNKCARINETADGHDGNWWTTGLWFCYGLPPAPVAAGVGAEQIYYSPEVWIQAIRPNDNVPAGFRSSLDKYNSITLLPPVL